MREITVSSKVCSKCRECKESSLFSRSCNYRDGLNSVCKSCQAAYSREWNRKNRDRFNHNKRKSHRKRSLETAKDGDKRATYSPDGLSRWCPKCKQRKSIGSFTLNKEGNSRKTQSWCKNCKNEDSANRRVLIPWETRQEQSKRSNLKRKGMLLEEYVDLESKQNGVCAICKEKAKNMRLAVAQDHSCCAGQKTCGKCNRGLLCATCNTLLHRLEKTHGWIEKALQYLQQHERPLNA